MWNSSHTLSGEEEGRKENITRIQRELLADKDLFNDYNRKLEYFKNKKMEMAQGPSHGNMNFQNVINDVHDNLQENSILDRSELQDNDRVIVRPKMANEKKGSKPVSLRKK